MKKTKNPKLKEGDRIILIHMPGEEITIGTKGKVIGIENAPSFGGSLGYQYEMEWYDDNDNIFSKLSLIPDTDSWMLDEITIKENKYTNLSSIDDLEKLANFLDLFRKKDFTLILEYLELIRELGVVNMFESTQFLGETSKYLEQYFNLYRMRKELDDKDEELIEKIVNMSENIRNIMISASIKDLEQKNVEITTSTVTSRFSKLKKDILLYFIDNNR